MKFMNRAGYQVLMMLLLPLLAACAGTREAPPTVEQMLAEKNFRIDEPVSRIRDYRLNGWNYLDREHVIMHSGVADSYLVSLRTNCDGLFSAENIAFSTTVGSLTDMDRLIVRGPGRWVESCYIESLHKLVKTQAGLETKKQEQL